MTIDAALSLYLPAVALIRKRSGDMQREAGVTLIVPIVPRVKLGVPS